MKLSKKNLIATAVTLTIGAFVGGYAADMCDFESEPALAIGLVAGGAAGLIVASGLAALEMRQRGDQNRKNILRIKELEGELQKNRERLNELKSAVASAHESEAATAATAETLTETITRLESTIERQQSELEQLTDKCLEVETELDQWENTWERLEGETRRQSKAEATAAAKDAFEKRLTQYKTKQKNAMAKAIRTRADRIAVKQVDEAVTEVSDRLNNTVAEVRAELEQTKAMLSTAQAELLALAENDEDERLHDELANRANEIIENLKAANTDLTQQLSTVTLRLKEYEKPCRFPDSPQYASGNVIIDTADEIGVRLDQSQRAVSESTGKESYYFDWHHSGAKPAAMVDTLNQNHRTFKERLIGAKGLSLFEFDAARCLIKVTIETHKKILTSSDMDRRWKTRQRFKELATSDTVFRLTGRKGASKSPLARNLLGCKMLAGEPMEIRRYDPTAGSPKDYWRIAPKWTDYKDALCVAEEIFSEIEGRKQVIADINSGDRKQPLPSILYYFIDEAENTISKLKGMTFEADELPENIGDRSCARYFSEALLSLAREAEHARMGLIFCTQSPMVSELPGWNRASTQNFTNLHIGNAAVSGLASSHNAVKLTKLLSDLEPISDFVERENSSIDDPKQVIRFALVEGGSASRYYAELPLLGYYGFDKMSPDEPYDFERFNMRDFPAAARSLDECLVSRKAKSASKPDSQQTGKSNKAVRKCPRCGGENIVRYQRGKNGKPDRWRCKDAITGDKNHPKTFLDPLASCLNV